MAGLDHLAHLNLVGPRDFLLQVEDELDAFVAGLGSGTGGGGSSTAGLQSAADSAAAGELAAGGPAQQEAMKEEELGEEPPAGTAEPNDGMAAPVEAVKQEEEEEEFPGELPGTTAAMKQEQEEPASEPGSALAAQAVKEEEDSGGNRDPEPNPDPGGALVAEAVKQEEELEEPGDIAAPTAATAPAASGAADKAMGGGTELPARPRRGIVFPALAQPYAELLMVAARRYGLQVSTRCDDRGGGARVAIEPGRGEPPSLPLFSYGDFLRPQRAAPAPAAAPGAALPPPDRGEGGGGSAGGTTSSRGPRERSLLRAWARRLPPPARGGAAAAPEVAELQASIEVRAGAEGTAPSEERPPPKPEACRRRGRGWEERREPSEEGEALGRPRHDYRRFGPKEARLPLYWRDSLMAPWPSVKLRRLQAPPVVWRPEWRVGLDVDDDPPTRGPQRGSMGGLLSWAVEPSAFGEGEGFEVSLRAGPGPAAEASRATEAGPERDDEDFVLSFRRSNGFWQFVAGKRSRLPALTAKKVEDAVWSSGSTAVRGKLARCMFWVACLKATVDGKHYVLVGPVPGILTEHFFVAKVARADPLSHAGFSYLPAIGKAASRSEEGPAIVVESITVYPHGLTGELPFVSHRFVEQCQTGGASTDEDKAMNDVLARAVLVAEAKDEPGNGGGDVAAAGLELRVCRVPRPRAAATAGWVAQALRECGLPVPRPAVTPEMRAERRAKRARLGPPMTASNFLEAPASWEPQPAEPPETGPFDDSIRHDPKRWVPGGM